MTNPTIMQYFEWYLPADGKHWQRLAEDAPHLKELGISRIWMPPAFKGTGQNDVGYGVYDLYDLGEFDQKGTIATKYGTKEDYLNAIKALHAQGIKAIADIVLNHKAGGDERERFRVLKMDPSNRQHPVSEPYDIEGWTGFHFPGRQGKYNDFTWHWYHFSGLDYDALHDEKGIYLILGDNKGWADQDQVDGENGNYDYLMFDDIDFDHPEVVAHLKDWVKWFIETTGIDGFRLDAVKHIKESFMANFISHVREHIKPDLYAFAEYWKGDSQATLDYIHATNQTFDLVDVVLHNNLFQASKQGKNYDLTQIFTGSLVQNDPASAVTFVDNHDSQRGQALESCIEEWFKPAAYCLILLRQAGIPCIFYGDYYGISGDFAQQDFKADIDRMMAVRQNHVHGEQIDYFDHANCIGWVNLGDDQHPDGSAIVISNSDAGWKRMDMGVLNAGKTFIDVLGRHTDTVQIGEDGWATFPVQAGSVSVWVNQDAWNGQSHMTAFHIQPLSQVHAEEIAEQWLYEPPYDFYNLAHDPEDYAELMEAETRGNHYFEVIQGEDFIGYCVLLPQGKELTIGLGLRPDLTGKGHGFAFYHAIEDYIKHHYEPTRLNLSVAAFNERAQKLYQNVGFIEIERYQQATNGGYYPFVRYQKELKD